MLTRRNSKLSTPSEGRWVNSPQTRLSLADGSWVELGPVLAKAGEGTIYGLEHRSNLVAKIFHPNLAGLSEKLAKVEAMTGTPPQGAVQGDGFVVLAWPQQVAYRDGAAVGFLMPRIDTAQAVEIHSLSNPSNRANPLPSAPQWTAAATWLHLVTAAANLCLAVDVVHHVDAVIGDFQERNILVANTVRVTLVDCDSMQFTDSVGRQYLSPLGRPEFTAPELARVDLRATARDKASDLFALAVHIHLLIMAGNHPFLRGTWTGAGDQPDALTLAQQGNWAGGPGSLLHTHPLAPPIEFLPNEIQALFTRAFTDGARDPAARPSADEWRQALSRIQVISCHRQPQHQIPAGADSCPWCDIEATRAARKAASGDSARPNQRIMPPLAARDVTAGGVQPVAAPVGSSAGGGSGNRWLLWGALALFVVGAVTAFITLFVWGDTAQLRIVTTPSTGPLEPDVRSDEDLPRIYLPTNDCNTATLLPLLLASPDTAQAQKLWGRPGLAEPVCLGDWAMASTTYSVPEAQNAEVLFHRSRGVWQYITLGGYWDCVAQNAVPFDIAAQFHGCSQHR